MAIALQATKEMGDESNTDTSDNNRESGDSDDEVYTWLPKAPSFELATWYGLL